MRYGTLSERGAEKLIDGEDATGLRVRYEPHPTWMGARNVWRHSNGQYIGGYVEVGPEGIIDAEGEPWTRYQGG